MTKRYLYNALGITGIMLVSFIIYFTHWRYGLPLHAHADESITTGNVQSMIGGGIKAPLVFNYPHLTFYLGYISYRIFSIFTVIDDLNFFLRVIICGTALFSNICIFFSARLITGKDRYGFIALLISVFSFYQFEYLYYTGPDAMLYAVANVTFLVALHIYYADDDLALKLYPLIAVLIGLAISAKYHGVLLGAMWLTIHIEKGYVKDIKKSLRFIGSCFLIVISFLLCNWKIFLDPSGFVSGFVFNFTHYASGHQGAEHNIPVLGYFETWVLYGFGIVGAFIFLLGIFYCLKDRKQRKLAIALLSVPVIIFIVLCRSAIVFGRNISQIAPVYYLFLMFGLMAIAKIFKKYKFAEIIPPVLAGLLSIVNIIYMVYINGYTDSYVYIENWIAENIEEGATIYLDTSYAPAIDAGMRWYNICYTNVELPEGVPNLQKGEYYVTSGWTYYRYVQENDYYFTQSGYMYPDDAKTYYDKVDTLDCVVEAESFCTTFGTNFRLKYLDIFSKNHDKFFAGPTIKVYTAK